MARNQTYSLGYLVDRAYENIYRPDERPVSVWLGSNDSARVLTVGDSYNLSNTLTAHLEGSLGNEPLSVSQILEHGDSLMYITRSYLENGANYISVIDKYLGSPPVNIVRKDGSHSDDVLAIYSNEIVTDESFEHGARTLYRPRFTRWEVMQWIVECIRTVLQAELPLIHYVEVEVDSNYTVELPSSVINIISVESGYHDDTRFQQVKRWESFTLDEKMSIQLYDRPEGTNLRIMVASRYDLEHDSSNALSSNTTIEAPDTLPPLVAKYVEAKTIQRQRRSRLQYESIAEKTQTEISLEARDNSGREVWNEFYTMLSQAKRQQPSYLTVKARHRLNMGYS